jgi:hypothetical protein
VALDPISEFQTGNGDVTAATVLVIGAGAGLFAAFCPSWFTVRSDFFNNQGSKDGNIRAIRQGELAGTITTLLQGYAASHLVDSILPFLGAVAVCAIMVAGYEWSIAHPASDDFDTSQSPLPKLDTAFTYNAAR